MQSHIKYSFSPIILSWDSSIVNPNYRTKESVSLETSPSLRSGLISSETRLFLSSIIQIYCK